VVNAFFDSFLLVSYFTFKGDKTVPIVGIVLLFWLSVMLVMFHWFVFNFLILYHRGSNT